MALCEMGTSLLFYTITSCGPLSLKRTPVALPPPRLKKRIVIASGLRDKGGPFQELTVLGELEGR